MAEEEHEETEEEENEAEQNMEESKNDVTDLEDDEDRPRSPLKKDKCRSGVDLPELSEEMIHKIRVSNLERSGVCSIVCK